MPRVGSDDAGLISCVALAVAPSRQAVNGDPPPPAAKRREEVSLSEGLSRTPLLQRRHAEQSLRRMLRTGRRSVSSLPIRAGGLTADRHADRHRRRDRVLRVGEEPDRRPQVPQPSAACVSPRRAVEPAAGSNPDRYHHLGAHEWPPGRPSWVRPGRTAREGTCGAVAQAVPANAVPSSWSSPDRSNPRSTPSRSRVRLATPGSSTARARRRRRRDHRRDVARGSGRVARRRGPLGRARRSRGNAEYVHFDESVEIGEGVWGQPGQPARALPEALRRAPLGLNLAWASSIASSAQVKARN